VSRFKRFNWGKSLIGLEEMFGKKRQNAEVRESLLSPPPIRFPPRGKVEPKSSDAVPIVLFLDHRMTGARTRPVPAGRKTAVLECQSHCRQRVQCRRIRSNARLVRLCFRDCSVIQHQKYGDVGSGIARGRIHYRWPVPATCSNQSGDVVEVPHPRSPQASDWLQVGLRQTSALARLCVRSGLRGYTQDECTRVDSRGQWPRTGWLEVHIARRASDASNVV